MNQQKMEHIDVPYLGDSPIIYSLTAIQSFMRKKWRGKSRVYLYCT